MAIDDNTVYGLTGAQVKELPGKIEAVKGKARVLTVDDYNYPADNPTGVALYLLEPGIYQNNDSTIRTYRYGTDTIVGTFVVGRPSSTSAIIDTYYLDGNVYRDYVVNGQATRNGKVATVNDIPPVTNTLTSASTTSALSANQGRVLKGLIDAIQVPTKTSDLTNDSNFVTSTQMDTALADKADTNDIPTALSELTNDINAVSDASYVHTDNNYTTVEKNKLAGIAAGAEANVQANWNETDATADDYIQNKPTIPTAVSQLTNDSGFTSNVGTITGVSANGTSVATAGVANIPSATTSRYGVTQLSTSTSSTSTTLAATPSAVRSAYNLAGSKATITMSATDPGEGSTLAANNFIAVYGDDPMSYSYNEVNTGATWVDGSTIYKKTLHVSALPASGQSLTVAHNIANFGVAVKIDGIMYRGDIGTSWVMPAYYVITLACDTTNVTIATANGLDGQNYEAYVTVYYTKTS